MALHNPAFDTDTDYAWLNDNARTMLQRGYLLEGVTAEERVEQIAHHAADILEMPDFAERFISHMANGYYSLASPVWANFGLDRGLPISCFGSYIEDTMESILYTHAEVGMMTKVGGGTSGYFGAIRPRGSAIGNNGTSNGSHSFAQLFDKIIDVVSQGSVRRGYFAGYQDIEHDDIEEWLQIQHEGDAIQGMYWGVVVGDRWMEEMISGDRQKRDIWAKVLQSRMAVGAPYILFRDNANRNRPQHYKDQGRFIKSSNLCSEILLPANADESFVCCLSSYNVETYDHWKDNPQVVKDLIYFLDAVIQEFIQKADGIPFMERAVRFARNHRALGAGVLGYHSYLQKHLLPFSSLQAMQRNVEIFKYLRRYTHQASLELGAIFGECKATEGTGLRNATTQAIAPTKSSSVILGQTSQGIQPRESNYYVADHAKVKYTFKNQYLERLIREKGIWQDSIWEVIMESDGSVQELGFLSDHEKKVFRTWLEIPQIALTRQAAQRQRYLDQGQSLNLAIDSKLTPTKDINKLYIDAWKNGVCTLYYQLNLNAAQQAARKMNGDYEQQQGFSILDCEACSA